MIDSGILQKSGILPYEQVDVLNINNGARFTTYAIEGKKGSGVIGVKGAAARLVQKDDLLIICSYAQMKKPDAKKFKPIVVMMDKNNKAI
jgi:aspartate 1-decarboxylase